MYYSNGFANNCDSFNQLICKHRKVLENETSKDISRKMCDLIDLNSPNKSLVNSKLASPLIPVPKNVGFNEQVNSVVVEKGDSLGSNPFDTVLHETTEYIKKKGDPFEVVLQRALKSKNKNIELKAQSVNFMDEFTPKHRRKNQKIMNKTLDESSIQSCAGPIEKKKEGENTGIVARNINVIWDTNVAENNKFIHEQSNRIMVMDTDSLELSILNQSAMNDTLLEVDPKHKVDNEISIFLHKDPLFKEFVFPMSLNLKPCLNLQRSLSQGDKKSPRKLQYQDKRSKSITDTLKKVSQSDNALLFVNKGLENKQSQQSVFSNLLDIPSTARLNCNSVSNLSSVSSNGIMNTAFMDSSCLNNERTNTAENSMEIKSVQYDLSDLTERLNKLKYAIDRTTSTLRIKEEIDKSNSIKEENSKQTMDNKLIDIEVFMPEYSFHREHNKSTNSTSSSDSVFTDSSKIDKSILNEAKALAKTFEELSLKTDSGSSTDDLISNNILWISELLPAYEEETVDNLIELPISPKENLKVNKNDLKQSSASVDNVEEDFMKKPQFIDNISTARQTTVTMLLLDLKKLVKAENNPEASKLIDNLENTLGITCKNDMELLASLSISNELQNSEIYDDKSDDIKSSKTSNDNSQKEDKKILSEKEICNNESSLPHVNHGSKNASQATTISSDNLLIRTSSCNDNNENRLNIIKSPKTTLNDSHSEKLAMELLINLGKLLSGQTEDATTLQLLKNIGKALNIASNNCKIKNESQFNDISRNTQQITAVKISPKKLSELNTPLSNSKEATDEQKFNSKFKPLEKTKRRSVSVIHSSDVNTSNMPLSVKRRSRSESKDQKRFSNHPGLINTVANKKIPISGTSNMKIVDTLRLDVKNDKSAIIDVKNKLKKKSGVINNKGPMKAVHPVSTIQKKVSLGKQTTTSSKVTTPPKSHTVSSGSRVISSTPNSIVPSTPDCQNNGSSKIYLISTNKKRNFSCDISPVTTQKEGSPKSKSPTAKKGTPKRQQTDLSGIPKYYTPPRKLNASLDMSSYHQKSPQYLNKSLTGYQRCSPIRPKSIEKKPRSPLKESNKIFAKVKPFKLISKLKGNTTGDFVDKENYSE